MTPLLGLIAGLLIAGPSADEIYARDFQGEYAPQGACARATERWVFNSLDVTEGETFCQVGGLTIDDGHLVVSTRNCILDGQAQKDRTYLLDLMSADVVKARVGETITLLTRCPTR